MEFKDRLRFLLDNVSVAGKRVTTYRIGKETTVLRASVENYLSGKQQPTIDKATIIAQYFGVTLNWLLIGDEDKKADETIPLSIVQMMHEERTRHDEMTTELIRQNGELVSILKKSSRMDVQDATCVAASGSGLQE